MYSWASVCVLPQQSTRALRPGPSAAETTASACAQTKSVTGWTTAATTRTRTSAVSPECAVTPLPTPLTTKSKMNKTIHDFIKKTLRICEMLVTPTTPEPLLSPSTLKLIRFMRRTSGSLFHPPPQTDVHKGKTAWVMLWNDHTAQAAVEEGNPLHILIFHSFIPFVPHSSYSLIPLIHPSISGLTPLPLAIVGVFPPSILSICL